MSVLSKVYRPASLNQPGQFKRRNLSDTHLFLSQKTINRMRSRAAPHPTLPRNISSATSTLLEKQGFSDWMSATAEKFGYVSGSMALDAASLYKSAQETFTRFWEFVCKVAQQIAKKFAGFLDDCKIRLLVLAQAICDITKKSCASILAFFRALHCTTSGDTSSVQSDMEKIAKALHEESITSSGLEKQSAEADSEWYAKFPETCFAAVVACINAVGGLLTTIDSKSSDLIKACTGLSGICTAFNTSAHLLKSIDTFKYIVDVIYYFVTGSHCFSTLQFLSPL